MSFRRLALPLIAAALCVAEVNWQSVTALPGVDWKDLTGAKKTAALRLMQTESCSCGCSMKIAECRVKDNSCAVSRKLAKAVVKGAAEGKSAPAIRTDLKNLANAPESLLEDPVTISTAGDPVRGPENARVTIVEFSDFQCPYCSKAVGQVAQVMRQFPKDIRLIYKQFPLDSHSEAEFGSEASLAAQAQGKFWEMHDRLYAGFPNLSRNKVFGYARELQLDMKRFTAEVDGHKYRARVMAEEKEGEEAGVGGTPTFFINGKKLNGNFEPSTVIPLIKAELK